MEEYPYFINGEFAASAKRLAVINPATEEVFADIFETSKEDFKKALAAAGKAAVTWRSSSFKERAGVLREISGIILDTVSVLARLEAKEIGKILKEPLFVDIPLGADCFNYYASFIESFKGTSLEGDAGIDTISFEPFGTCGVYLPYNVPLMIFGFSCAAALAAGNALIVKPSEYGSLSVLELAKHLKKLDIPKGLINIISGRGEAVGSLLAQSDVDMLSFTGSPATLKKIFSGTASSPKKIVCELGGCNITAVFSDADQEEALQNVMASSFMKQGQLCIGTSMLLVEEHIYDDFKKVLLDKIHGIKLGNPFEPTSGMGPLVTREHLRAVDEKVKDVIAGGGTLLCGGKQLPQKGYFYPPTVIEVDQPRYEEFFAPVILIKSFSGNELDDIIAGNPSGLVFQVWTKNLQKARMLAKKARCGTVWINAFAQMNPHTPFGGMRKSGWGRNLGPCGFFEYVHSKHTGVGLNKTPLSGWFGV